VGVGAIAFEVFGRDGSRVAPTRQPSSPPAAAQPSGDCPQQEPACSQPPGVEATSWELTRDGLAIAADLSAACEDGNVVSGCAATVVASMGSADIASGVFDLSAEPIAISPGGHERRTFVFPAGIYWRPPELISDSVTMTITDSGSASGSDSVVNGGATLTAVKGAPPEHGSEDGIARNALEELSAADYPHRRVRWRTGGCPRSVPSESAWKPKASRGATPTLCEIT
jgi:hypothetical protein